MTLTPQPTVWAMPVACSEAFPRGQAEACKAPTDPDVLDPCPCPHGSHFCLPHGGSIGPPCSPTSTSAPLGLTLRPWDPADLGEGSAPKEVGVHAGPAPLAHPLPRAKRGAQGYKK